MAINEEASDVAELYDHGRHVRACQLNLAAVCLETKSFEEALQWCEAVLADTKRSRKVRGWF